MGAQQPPRVRNNSKVQSVSDQDDPQIQKERETPCLGYDTHDVRPTFGGQILFSESHFSFYFLIYNGPPQ
jgi:hypothetical protein